jgi:hypothetical protein
VLKKILEDPNIPGIAEAGAELIAERLRHWKSITNA